MRLSLLICCQFLFWSAVGQIKISGTVVDESGIPVPMANVFIKDSYDGTTASENGTFSFQTTESGSQILVVTMIGFKEFQQSVVLASAELKVNVVMEELISELNAVTISAGAFMASDESRRTVFRAVDIATTAGATADIAGALNTLPGTQKVGESGRLFVRGGDGSEARTFIDGLVVLDAYGPAAPNTPSRGRFLPFMFKGTSFSTGGYSSEYGQALSSALVLDSKDESEIDRTDIGLLSVGADVAHTQAWKNGSVAGKIQYTNLRPYTNLINQEIDWIAAPQSYEGVAAFRQRVGKSGMVKAYANINDAQFSLFNHDIDDASIKSKLNLTNKYRYGNLFYKDALNNNWIVRGGLSYTSIGNTIQPEGQIIDDLEHGWHAKTVFEGSINDQLELKTGAEVIRRSYNQTGFASGPFDVGFIEQISAAFAEGDVYASSRFVTRAGVRAEHNNLNGEVHVDPRVSLAYKTDEHGQVSVAYGRFHQSAKNEFIKLNTALKSESATHYILNYQRIEDNRTFRVEAYYKTYADLIKFSGASLTNSGNGYARGIELFWRDNRSIRNLDYWISYSFLDTERNYLHFPVQSTPGFASKHNYSIVGKYFVQKIKSQLGATFSYASSRAFENPNLDQFNAGRTPSYQDLSFNWSYLPKPYLIVYFSCTNLLGRDNIFGYQFSDQVNNEGFYNSRPIRQAAPRFLFVGIFLTISKDKSMNQLPTL